MKRGDFVELKYNQEDLEQEDLGMSGIVLDSPLKKIGRWINSTFEIIGTLKEDERFFVISLVQDGIDRDFVIHHSYLKLRI